MIDVVPHYRKQIHETTCEPIECRRKSWDGFGQPLNAPALKGGVVRNDRPHRSASLHQAFGEDWPRITGAIGKPLVVGDAAILILHVATELHGDEIVRTASGPDRDRQAHRLEVEKRYWRLNDFKSFGEGWFDDDSVLPHRPALPILNRRQRDVVWQVGDQPVPLPIELGGP